MRPNAVQRQPRRRHAGRGGSLGDLKLKMREGMRSPPARSRADYFFKVHKPSARQGEARADGRPVGGPSGAIIIVAAPRPRRRATGRRPFRSDCNRWSFLARAGRRAAEGLRAISRFRHQDAQTPPSPLVGEGGWGDEGQRRIGMQNIAHLSQKLYT